MKDIGVGLEILLNSNRVTTDFDLDLCLAIKALLSDLQHTTEVLKRTKLNDRCISSASDLEPIYQEQTRSYGSCFHGLDSIEQMLDDYSQKRKTPEDEWYANSLTSQAERPTVQSLFRELEHDSCSRSVGGLLSQPSGNVQVYMLFFHCRWISFL
ncbi:unnamed protein product [Wuchereria bancrofti]|uniref:Uncharacterized protein n=1 Tax=Wuchereria bancrofti TaxID=6293 RepID=A0A3P7E0Z8_WUCBA|nr:unnamed protein product [Wuchereria bancrofti]